MKNQWSCSCLNVIILFCLFIFAFSLIIYIGSFFNYGSYRQREDLFVVVHKTTVVVLGRGYYAPKGHLYFIEKTDNKWQIKQTIDITPFLKGRTVGDMEINDDYLVLTAFKGTMVDASFYASQNKDKSTLILLKKKKNQWEFYRSFLPENNRIDFQNILLTEDNQLMTAERACTLNGYKGTVRIYDLQNNPPTLIQAIVQDQSDPRLLDKPSKTKSSKENLFTSGLGDIMASSNNILVLQNVSDKRSRVGFSWTDWLVYTRNGSKWEYNTSLLKLLPDSIYKHPCATVENELGPFQFAYNVDIDENSILVYDDSVEASRYYHFIRDDKGHWLFKERKALSSDYDAKGNERVRSLDENKKCRTYCLQKKDNYSVRWAGEDSLRIVPPSEAGLFDYVPSKWIVQNADEDTYRLSLEHPPINHHYPPYFTQENPRADYSLFNNIIATTYSFDNCYYSDHELHKAKVWGGVNIFEIDPKKQTIQTTRFVIEKTDPYCLKPVN